MLLFVRQLGGPSEENHRAKKPAERVNDACILPVPLTGYPSTQLENERK